MSVYLGGLRGDSALVSKLRAPYEARDREREEFRRQMAPRHGGF